MKINNKLIIFSIIIIAILSIIYADIVKMQEKIIKIQGKTVALLEKRCIIYENIIRYYYIKDWQDSFNGEK